MGPLASGTHKYTHARTHTQTNTHHMYRFAICSVLSSMLVTLLFVLLVLTSMAPASAKKECLDVIRELSVYDRQLGSRINQKKAAAESSATSHAFVSAMLAQPATGTAWACGLTLSWVTEVFEGLGSQYTEYRNAGNFFNGQAARYTAVTGGADVGSGIQQLFSTYRTQYPDDLVIFHLQHTGSVDHIVTIEQLPGGAGYRLYQSYVDAHSLAAWLTKTNPNQVAKRYSSSPDTGELSTFRSLQQAVASLVWALTGGTNDLTLLPLPFQDLVPFVQFVQGFDEQQAVGAFLPTWEKYGGGRVLNNSVFDEYIAKTGQVAQFFKDNDRSATSVVTQEVYDLWIELYGTPNTLYYPGLTTDRILNIVDPSGLLPGYRLEVLPVVQSGDANLPSLKNGIGNWCCGLRGLTSVSFKESMGRKTSFVGIADGCTRLN